MNLMSLLSVNGYIIVNRQLVGELGLEPAVMMSTLCSEYEYWLLNNRLHYGMFYCTIEKLQALTGLSYHLQSKCIKILESRNLISVVVDGMPATRYFKINEDQLAKLLHITFHDDEKVGTDPTGDIRRIPPKKPVENDTTVFKDFENLYENPSKQDVKDFQVSNNINTNNKNTTKNIFLEEDNIDQHISKEIPIDSSTENDIIDNVSEHITTVNEVNDDVVPQAESTLVQAYGRKKADPSPKHENDALKEIQASLNKIDTTATVENKEKQKKMNSTKAEDDTTDYGLPSNNPIADRIYKDFLGSAKAPTATQLKKANRFTKCVMAIDDFIDPSQDGSMEIKQLLVRYLNMRFEDRSAQMYVNQWRGMLSKLLAIVAQDNCDIHDVINQSIERGWKNFYPINQKFKNKGHIGSAEYYDMLHDGVESNYNFDTDQQLLDDINRNQADKSDKHKKANIAF